MRVVDRREWIGPLGRLSLGCASPLIVRLKRFKDPCQGTRNGVLRSGITGSILCSVFRQKYKVHSRLFSRILSPKVFFSVFFLMFFFQWMAINHNLQAWFFSVLLDQTTSELVIPFIYRHRIIRFQVSRSLCYSGAHSKLSGRS